MTIAAFILSLLVAAMGALGVASPAHLLGVVRRFQSRTGLFLAGLLRVCLGAALYFAAPTSRAPELIRVLGVFILVAGLVTPFFGLARFRRVLEWWSSNGPTFIRAWAFFALAFGISLAYAVAP